MAWINAHQACRAVVVGGGYIGLEMAEQLHRRGLSVALAEVVHLHPGSHAGYYPGATPLTLKLLYAPGSGKLLGAQVVGAEGVDKRLDVLATGLQAGMTVHDLADLELAYAPPFSSAKIR